MSLCRVIAVVPTYHPDSGVPARLSALQAQVDEVVVVDDGSDLAADTILDELSAQGCIVIRSGTNRGIAAALNTGTRVALQHGAAYVLHSDQDTVLPPEYVSVALAVFGTAHRVTNLGVVAADAINGRPALPTWTSPEGLGLVPEAIQTGLLIAREVFEVAGFLDERLVIDCVDTEFCLRIRDRGFKIAIARGTDTEHALGRRAPLKVFGVPISHRDGRAATYEYHPPFRRYYITRNNIDLMLRNVRRRPRWVMTALRRQYSITLVSMMSGPQALGEFVAVVVGIVDGLRRRRGPISPALRRRLVR